MTPTIRHCTWNLKKVHSQYFSLQLHTRTFDLKAATALERDKLAEAFRRVIAFNREHKPQKIDTHVTLLV